METKQEYGLFNKLPDGKTINDIPVRLRWLYVYPFRTDYSLGKMKRVRDEINEQRAATMFKMDYRGDVKTYCYIKECTVTRSDWIEYEED